MVRRTQNLTSIQLGEAKRKYIAHFTSKLTDCDGENAETETWIDFSKDCNYITLIDYRKLAERNESIGKMLGNMINRADQFCQN